MSRLPVYAGWRRRANIKPWANWLTAILVAAFGLLLVARLIRAWSDLSTSTLTGPAAALVGDTATYTAVVSNTGTTADGSYIHVMHIPDGAAWQSSAPGMLPLQNADGRVIAALKWLPSYTGTTQLTTSVRYGQPGVSTFYGVNSYKQTFVNLFTPATGLWQETAVTGTAADIEQSPVPTMSIAKPAWQWAVAGCCTPGGAVTLTLWVTPVQAVSDASLWIPFPSNWQQNASAQSWRAVWAVPDGPEFYSSSMQQQVGAYAHLGDLAAPISVTFTGYYSAPVDLRADLYAADRLAVSSSFRAAEICSVYLPIILRAP